MGTLLRVLIVEDSEDDALLLLRELRRGGYDPISERVDTPAAMDEALDRHTWDIVLSDYAMPRFTMHAALAKVCQKGLDAPFIIVSGAIGEEAAVSAMRAGAKDYVMKNNLARLVPVVERELLQTHMRHQRNHMEQALQELGEEIQQQWRQMLTMFENFPEMLYVADPETYEILFVSKALKNASGKELVGCKCYKELHKLDAPCSFCTNEIIVKERKPYAWEHHNPTLDRDYLIIDQIIRWPNGRDVKFEVAIDLTERAVAGPEVNGGHDRMARLERLKASGEMAAGVAHDVNNLLSIIMCQAEMALDNVRDGNLKKRIKVIEQAAKDGSSAVRRLQKPAGAKEHRNLDVVSLHQLVEDVLEMVEPRRLEFEKNKSAAITISADLGEVATVAADAVELREALVNLIFNAMDAMPRGGNIQVKTAQEDSFAILSVSDTGQGIPEEIIAKIFNPFFTTKPSKGSGLGLSMTQSIIAKHGGIINVKSTVGKGTTFYVRLPIAVNHDGE